MARNARRVTPGPLLVRAIAFSAGIIAAGIAMPVSLMSPAAMFSGVVLSGLAAVKPGSVLVSLVQLCTVMLWFVGTGLGAGPLSTPALIGLACALYAQHTACALAAAVPLDAVVLPTVLLRWFTRVGAVMLATAALGVVTTSLSGGLRPSSSWVFPVLGVAGAIVAVGILAYLALRVRRPGA